ncbi:MAG: hypothetical protein HOW73_31280 [Polyangiaceae bacterium]|nr:hypothetical protein [Polyangiaceae bacterium]
MYRSLLLASVALVSGCAGVYGPIPDPNGKPSEALYELRSEDGRFGTARIVASDAKEIDVQGEPRAVVSVEVLVDNDDIEEVLVASRQVSISYVDTNTGRIEASELEVVQRKATSLSEGVARVEAAYALPRGYTARDVRGYGVRWAVVRDGETYEEVTAFARPSSRYAGLFTGSTTPFVVYTYPPPGSYYDPIVNSYYEPTPLATSLASPPSYNLPSITIPATPPPPEAPPINHAPAQPGMSFGHVPAQPTIGGRN